MIAPLCLSVSRAKCNATYPPVMAAVRVPPSARSTSQSMVTVFSPKAAMSVIRPQGASGQALDFLGSAGWASAGNLSSDPFVGRPRQHRVFGSDPAHAAASAPAGDPRRHGGSADDVGFPHLDQCRSLSPGHETWGDRHRPKLLSRTAVRPSCVFVEIRSRWL